MESKSNFCRRERNWKIVKDVISRISHTEKGRKGIFGIEPTTYNEITPAIRRNKEFDVTFKEEPNKLRNRAR